MFIRSIDVASVSKIFQIRVRNFFYSLVFSVLNLKTLKLFTLRQHLGLPPVFDGVRKERDRNTNDDLQNTTQITKHSAT
jgi:hypothetical protein